MLEEQSPLQIVSEILKFCEVLNSFQDVDTILDRILSVARRLSRADAGTIFLLDGETLRFGYVHNDTLISEHDSAAQKYLNQTLPVDMDSIAGFVAVTGQAVCIDDAYAIPGGYPFGFNTEFDQRAGYRTGSILALPLQASGAGLVGVMQLINAQDRSGAVQPFTETARTYLPLLAVNAAAAVERGRMTRELVLRMMRMAALHDPKETGAHVQRVGAYAAEIYTSWATLRGENTETQRRTRDLLRLAAMLHDVGKVGISDLILKKPGSLSPEEFLTMKLHTVFGARLFAHSSSELDAMAAAIALNHHERWDGQGYPGTLPDLHTAPLRLGTPKVAEEIPLPARIVAVADVYDALRSTRSYKQGWPEERILEHLREQAGQQFDPEVVRAFFQAYPVFPAIQAAFAEGTAGQQHAGDGLFSVEERICQ